MKKFLQTIFILVYAVVAVTVTVLLLSYNDYKISEIGEKTVYPVTSDLSEKYKKGCLLIINKAKQGDIKVGDKVFYYRAISKESFEVVLDTVIDIEKSGSKETYLFEGNEQHGIDDIIGKESNTAIYENLGTVLSILESRWGYLFLVVIVTLMLLLQEIFALITEIKYGNEEETEEKGK